MSPNLSINRFFYSYQVVIYILVIPLLIAAYVFEYTPSLQFLPYMFVSLIFFILLGNHFSGLYLNSTYSLFLISFSTFIGGRFFAYIFDNSLPLFDMHFFVSYISSESEALQLMTYLIVGVCFLDLGFKLARITNHSFGAVNIDHSWMKKLCILSLLLSPLFSFEMLMNIKDAITGGYLSSKLWQTKSYSFPLSSLAQTLFGISFGYAMLFNYQRKLFMAIFISSVLGSLVIGARGPVISALLLYLWATGKNGTRKLNVIKIGLIGLTIMISVSYFIQLYSFRSNGEDFESDLAKFLVDFVYEQGISVMVFDVSMKVSNYPWLAYFQTFLPGSSALASIFIPVEYYMTGFQHYMARELDPILFSAGYGLDWTLFSDFFVIGGENIIGFSLGAFAFGYFLSVLQNSTTNYFWLILLYSLFTRLMFLPRSSLSTIVPFLIYFFVFVFVIPRIRFR